MADMSIGNTVNCLNMGGRTTTVAQEIGSHRFTNAVSRYQENDEYEEGGKNPVLLPDDEADDAIKSRIIALRTLIETLLTVDTDSLNNATIGVDPWLPDVVDIAVEPPQTAEILHITSMNAHEDIPESVSSIPIGQVAPHSECIKIEEEDADIDDVSEPLNTVSIEDDAPLSSHDCATSLLWCWGQFIGYDIHHDQQSYDASMIYGATEAMSDTLRAFEGGRMLVSYGDHLPIGLDGTPQTGHQRMGEQPSLMALHTVFLREHNRLAEYIAAQNPEWTDSDVFKAVRSYITMEVQAITYNTFLPIITAENVLDAHKDITGATPSEITFLNQLTLSDIIQWNSISQPIDL